MNMVVVAKRIGITGGIGSGKSTVSQYFANLGVPVIDADAIARALTSAGGRALPAIAQTFGAEYVTESGLDRAKLRTLVFEQPDSKQHLEQLLHPMIREEMQHLYDLHKHKAAYVIFDIPLLVESIERYRKQLDVIAVVDCDKPTQIKRVQARSQLSPELIERIMATQVDRQQRLAVADVVIDNGQEVSLNVLNQQLAQLHARWSQQG